MVVLGGANSRMKDFYDIWLLSRVYEFTGESLGRAIAATFARRKTPIPEKDAGRLDTRLRRGPGEAAAMEFLCRGDRCGSRSPRRTWRGVG